MTTEKQFNQQERKQKQIRRGFKLGYQRNHKQPIPALWENPRYTGACKTQHSCGFCTGDS